MGAGGLPEMKIIDPGCALNSWGADYGQMTTTHGEKGLAGNKVRSLKDTLLKGILHMRNIFKKTSTGDFGVKMVPIYAKMEGMTLLGFQTSNKTGIIGLTQSAGGLLARVISLPRAIIIESGIAVGLIEETDSDPELTKLEALGKARPSALLKRKIRRANRQAKRVRMLGAIALIAGGIMTQVEQETALQGLNNLTGDSLNGMITTVHDSTGVNMHRAMNGALSGGDLNTIGGPMVDNSLLELCGLKPVEIGMAGMVAQSNDDLISTVVNSVLGQAEDAFDWDDFL